MQDRSPCSTHSFLLLITVQKVKWSAPSCARWRAVPCFLLEQQSLLTIFRHIQILQSYLLTQMLSIFIIAWAGYGTTHGHRKMNIRVVIESESDINETDTAHLAAEQTAFRMFTPIYVQNIPVASHVIARVTMPSMASAMLSPPLSCGRFDDMIFCY